MVKTYFFILFILSNTLISQETTSLAHMNCINCHIKQKIPSELVYRRYLRTYSTHSTIEKKLFNYLQNPTKETSIMPLQFFLKFPEKQALDLNETVLKESIEAYLDYFDVRSKLTLP